MSETPSPAKGLGGVMRKKVAGVPVIYLAAGFVVILAVLAWKMKPNSDLAASDNADATDAESDAGSASGSNIGGTSLDGAVPNVPSGTVVVAPQANEPEDAPYEDNSTWLRKAVAFLIAHGKNPGEAQNALQAYLAGENLTYAQGQMRDMVVKEFGLPPDDFRSGSTASAPKPATTVTPTPPKPAVPAKPKTPPPPKPSPPTHQTYIVRHGDNLTKIASKFHVKGGWKTLYEVPANRAVIGPNPNLIKPGQRLVIP